MRIVGSQGPGFRAFFWRGGGLGPLRLGFLLFRAWAFLGFSVSGSNRPFGGGDLLWLWFMGSGLGVALGLGIRVFRVLG